MNSLNGTKQSASPFRAHMAWMPAEIIGQIMHEIPPVKERMPWLGSKDRTFDRLAMVDART